MENEEEEKYGELKKEIQSISNSVFQEILDDELRIPSKVEISEFAISQQLNCALTFIKMTQPAKTKACRHIWAIELEYFKELDACPCNQPITEDNIIIDELLLRLIQTTNKLNELFFSEDSLFQYSNEVMLFKRSLLFFPCYDQSAIPKPLFLLQEHIKLNQNINLTYNFSFKISDLTQITFKNIVRTCQGFCIYDFDNLNFDNQIETCQFCQKQIDVFNFQIDTYLMKVRQLLLSLHYPKEKDLSEVITMMFGKFKLQKQFYTMDNIDAKLLSYQSLY